MPETVTEDLAIEVQVRRHAVWEFRVVCKAGEGGDGASFIRILVIRTFILPVVPDLVNHRVVHEEQGVVRGPCWSLNTFRGTTTIGTEATQVPGDYEVNAGMDPRSRLHIRLKSLKVALKIVHHIIHVLLGHSRVDHQVCLGRRNRRVAGEYVKGVGKLVRENRKVPPDSVGAWIRQHYVFESTSGDLIIIGGVTPGTNARSG